MVRQLTVFSGEVTRVALEVGTQGILGGQAKVEGVEGVWDDLTTNVNVSYPMSGLVTAHEVENGAESDRTSAGDRRSGELELAFIEEHCRNQLIIKTKSVARGDLTKTVNADVQGEILDLKITVNDMVSFPHPTGF